MHHACRCSSVEATPTHTPVEKISPARCGHWQHWKVVDDGPCKLHDESCRADEVPRASVVHCRIILQTVVQPARRRLGRACPKGEAVVSCVPSKKSNISKGGGGGCLAW
jgi:hypothetical protein